MVSILLVRDGFHFSLTKRMGLMHSIIRPREFLSELLGRQPQSFSIISYSFFNKPTCSILPHTQIDTLLAKHTIKKMHSRSYSGTFIMVIIAKSGGLSLAILSARCILVSCPRKYCTAMCWVHLVPRLSSFYHTGDDSCAHCDR